MTFSKDPDSTLDYTVDWSDWLAGTDTIATSSWIVPDKLDQGLDTKTATSTTIWLSGGTLGESYQVVNRITTVGGRTEDRTFAVVITEH